MYQNPVISVVIPTFNRASQLKDCLFSIFNQEFNFEYEVILVDDASTDKTQELLEKYFKNIPNLKVLRNPKNMGSYYSRNLGVSNARSEIVSFTDSDTVVPSNWLSKIYSAFQNNDVSCIQGTQKRRGKWELPIPENNLLNHEVFRTRKGLDTKNLSIKRDLILKYKFDQRFGTGGDKDLGYRLNKDGVNIMYNPKISVTHFDMRGFWDTVAKGKYWGEAFAMHYQKHGWNSINPRLRYPFLILIFIYLGSFFYLLAKYKSLRGSISMTVRNLVSMIYFKINSKTFS